MKQAWRVAFGIFAWLAELRGARLGKMPEKPEDKIGELKREAR